MADAPPAPGVRETVLGSGAGGPLTAPTPWETYVGYIKYSNGGVVIGNPIGGNKGAGTINLPAGGYYRDGVLINPDIYIPLAGGNMTGMLNLYRDPISSDPGYVAATKNYVDLSIGAVPLGSYLPLAGGILTGSVTVQAPAALTLGQDPVNNLEAATKQYVDTKFLGIIGIADAPHDHTTYGRKDGAWTDTSIIDVGTF